MRLGFEGMCPNGIEDFADIAAQMKELGLGAICIDAAKMDERWTLDYCYAFGEKARELDVMIGEIGYWDNILNPNEEIHKARFDRLCYLMKCAEAMQAKTVVALVGTKDASDHTFAPHPYMMTQACRMKHEIMFFGF